MVEDTRVLERTLGTGAKKIEQNEIEARVVQRRCIRFASNLDSGHTITRNDLVSLRPAPIGSFDPFEIEQFIGLKIQDAVLKHQVLTKDLF